MTFKKTFTKKELKKLAFKDNLTGVYNRNAFDIIADKVGAKYFVIFDIDHFKKINDIYGHDVGDIVLKTVAQTLNKELLVFRWGGEEFVALIPETENIDEYLNLIREKIANIKIKEYPNIKITVSIGYTLYDKKKDIKEVFKEADEALYCAKTEGRNRVVKYQIGMNCPNHIEKNGQLVKRDKCESSIYSKIYIISNNSLEKIPKQKQIFDEIIKSKNIQSAIIDKSQYKELIEKAMDLDWLYENHAQNFNKELIKLAIKKGKFLDVLYINIADKMDKELIKLAIDKGVNLFELYEKVADKMDKELIKYAIDKGVFIGKLYDKVADKMDKELIKYAIDKRKGLFTLYEKVADRMDKELIKYAIEKGTEAIVDLSYLYEKAADKMDKELIKLAIDKGLDFFELYENVADKMDKELIKYAIASGKDLYALYKKVADRMDKELIKYAIDRGIHLEYLYKNFTNKMDKELIEYVIRNNKEPKKLYYYLSPKQKQIFDEIIKSKNIQSDIIDAKKVKEICVDLDGTLIIDKFPDFGEPIAENVEILRKLKEKGFRIIIFTARLSSDPFVKEKIEKFLKENNIPFDEITNIKPYTTSVFIDDRNIEVDYNSSWPDDLEEKINEIIKKHKIKADFLKDELTKSLEGLTSDDIAKIIEVIKEKQLIVPPLKLAFPEFVFKTDLLKKMLKRDELIL